MGATPDHCAAKVDLRVLPHAPTLRNLMHVPQLKKLKISGVNAEGGGLRPHPTTDCAASEAREGGSGRGAQEGTRALNAEGRAKVTRPVVAQMQRGKTVQGEGGDVEGRSRMRQQGAKKTGEAGKRRGARREEGRETPKEGKVQGEKEERVDGHVRQRRDVERNGDRGLRRITSDKRRRGKWRGARGTGAHNQRPCQRVECI